MMSTSVVSCPFCDMTHVSVISSDTWFMVAICVECGARGPEALIQEDGPGSRPQKIEDARARAMAAWNTRAPVEPKD